MKYKSILPYTIFTIIPMVIIVCLSTCKNEDIIPSNLDPLLLNKGKYIFNEWKSKTNTLKNSPLELGLRTDTIIENEIFKIPLWDNAVHYYDELRHQEVIEVPLLRNDYQTYRLGEDSSSIEFNDTMFYSEKKLLILKELDGHISIIQMNIIGEESYITNGGNLKNNNYEFKESNFKGLVFYSDWLDRYEIGYYFENGNSIGQITAIGTDTILDNLTMRWACRVPVYYPCHHGSIRCPGDTRCQRFRQWLGNFDICIRYVTYDCGDGPSGTGNPNNNGAVYGGFISGRGSIGGDGIFGNNEGGTNNNGSGSNNNSNINFNEQWGNGGADDRRSIHEIELNNTRLSTNKILGCLTNSTSEINLEMKLKKILGYCQIIDPIKIKDLSILLFRKPSNEWYAMIYVFLLTNKINQTCLKSIFDANNCENTTVNGFETEFKNNYGIDIWNDYPDYMEECIGSTDLEGCMFKKIFKITDSHYNCIANYPDLKIQIAELINSNIIDPCRPEKTSSELVNELLDEICNSPENKFNLFKNELEKSDWIQFFNNFLDNPRLKCIMKKIISSNNNLYCTTLENFDGVSSISVKFSYTSFKNDDHSNDISRDGVTDWGNENGGGIVIWLNSNTLENDGDWNAVQTILHEGIHANILKIFFDNSLSQIEQKYPIMYSYFKSYKETTWDWEHEYMANEMIDELITSLKEVFGTNYTDEEYEYMAWGGLKITKKWSIQTNTTEQNRINAHKTSIDSKNIKICP